MVERPREGIRLDLPSGGALQGYLTRGDGERVVLSVHGLGSRCLGEKALALEAACARRVWSFAAFDFRGHGESSGTMIDVRGSGLLDDLAAIRAALADRGLRQLYLFGSSMGGWATAWFALRHPDAVRACALVAPALNFPRGRWDRMTEAERVEWQRTGRTRLQNQWLDVELGYGVAEERDRYPLELLAGEWATPLLIFHGMQDDVISYRQSMSFVERLAYPQVELRLYGNGDHRLAAFKAEMAEGACRLYERH